MPRQCDGCITTHVHAALKHGTSTEEIAEALGVAIAVNAGAALVYSARVMDAVAAYSESSGTRLPIQEGSESVDKHLHRYHDQQHAHETFHCDETPLAQHPVQKR